jgi:hypothetical protein
VSVKQLRQRCVAKLREYQVPRPFDLDLFRAEVERIRGRPIVFVPVRTGVTTGCGMWLQTADTDYILHEAFTSPLHEAHIKLHELAHVMWGHQGSSPFAADFLRLVLPDLDPTAVQQVLGRGTYTRDAENEAEMLATVIGEYGAVSQLPHQRAAQPADVADQLRRLASSLEHPDDRDWPGRPTRP